MDWITANLGTLAFIGLIVFMMWMHLRPGGHGGCGHAGHGSNNAHGAEGSSDGSA